MEDNSYLICHKFKELNTYTWSSLISSSLYFSSPSQLNDPADCQIDLLNAMRQVRAKDSISVQEANRFAAYVGRIQERAKRSGILSLCKGEINGDSERLLWAHYAANHSGVCLTYKIPYAFVVDQLVGCDEVQYSNEVLFDVLRNLDLSRDLEYAEEVELVKPLIIAYFTTKAHEWSYEEEFRLVSYTPGLIAIDPSWLVQICFGLRTSPNDRETLTTLASTTYPGCRIAEAIRSESELFRLEINEL